jgi:hypothetical protein
MGAAAGLLVEVHGSRGLALALGGFFTACAVALYLSASALAGPFAGGMAALGVLAGLAGSLRRQARDYPCWLWLGEHGSIEWRDRMGRPGSGHVVAAVRVGGLWVSLSVQPDGRTRARDRARGGMHGSEHDSDHDPAQTGPGGFLRRLWPTSHRCTRPRSWLLPADALDPEAFRALAVRVPHIPQGRP